MVRKKKEKDQSIGIALSLPRVEVSAPEAAGCTRRSCPLPCPATKKTKQKQSVVIVPALPATSIQYMQCHWLTAAQVAVSSRAARCQTLPLPSLGPVWFGGQNNFVKSFYMFGTIKPNQTYEN